MPKSYKERVAALEALEAGPPRTIEEAAVAALSDAALLEETVRGLRTHTITPCAYHGYVGMDAYWSAVAVRAVLYCIAHQGWVIPTTSDDLADVLRGLDSGAIVLQTTPRTAPSGVYRLYAPPLPNSEMILWRYTPLGIAAEHVSDALNVYTEHARAGAPEDDQGYPWAWQLDHIPLTQAAVADLLREWHDTLRRSNA